VLPTTTHCPTRPGCVKHSPCEQRPHGAPVPVDTQHTRTGAPMLLSRSISLLPITAPACPAASWQPSTAQVRQLHRADPEAPRRAAGSAGLGARCRAHQQRHGQSRLPPAPEAASAHPYPNASRTPTKGVHTPRAPGNQTGDGGWAGAVRPTRRARLALAPSRSAGSTGPGRPRAGPRAAARAAGDDRKGSLNENGARRSVTAHACDETDTRNIHAVLVGSSKKARCRSRRLGRQLAVTLSGLNQSLGLLCCRHISRFGWLTSWQRSRKNVHTTRQP
jgi:hypothetical protein